jgi:hypothetical protein
MKNRRAFNRGWRRGPVIWAATSLCALASAHAQQFSPSDAASDADAMAGLYGRYDMTRESSGTSWQPDASPMSGVHTMRGPWMLMSDAFANLIYDEQGGPRGAVKTFSTSMFMIMGRRELGSGALGLRLMLSGDPLMGRDGYPELFQTGETANGVTPLIDRQHPHDLLMEAALTYSHDLAKLGSLFLYAGLPGEPALGPPAFMHRLSSTDDPEAPLTHHWLDSTHVSWGVVTAGLVSGNMKLEASAFNGREPDQNHYTIETGHLDSYAARLSFNPGSAWSLQASTGHLVSPEQLQPEVNVQRTTASVSYQAPFTYSWQTTFAFGRNVPSVGLSSNAWLLESEARITLEHTVFARLERVAKDELFLPDSVFYGRNFTINALTIGYIRDFARVRLVRLGVGGLVTSYSYPQALNASYGYRPTSFMLFMRARL